jgi:putative transposase
VRYAWIQDHAGTYPVALLCHILDVSASGYYDWRDRKPSARQQRRERIAAAAGRSYHDSRRIYGYRKVHQEVVQEARIDCCRETVRRVLAEQGLFSRVKRRFVVTTDSRHDRPVAENLLDRDFTASAPNRKWTADITYLPTAEGWLYLSVVLDVFSRRIVGWSMSSNLDAALVSEALRMALLQRRPGEGLLHHSDRGVQYTSGDFVKLLNEHGITCSMSRKGDCWDNAVTESFFGSLKTEWTLEKSYRTRAEAKQDVFQYIEVFYNRKRRHASLGYVSPAEYEERYEATVNQVA